MVTSTTRPPPFRGRGDRPVMGMGNGPHDGQPQFGACLPSGARGTASAERLEQDLDLVLGDYRAGVADHQPPIGVDRDQHLTAGHVVAHDVVHQVAHQLAEQQRIARHGDVARSVQAQARPVELIVGGDFADDLAGDRAQVHGLPPVQALFTSGQRQQSADQCDAAVVVAKQLLSRPVHVSLIGGCESDLDGGCATARGVRSSWAALAMNRPWAWNASSNRVSRSSKVSCW